MNHQSVTLIAYIPNFKHLQNLVVLDLVYITTMTSVESNTCWTGTASTHGTNLTNTATATCTTVKTEAEIVPSETKTNIQIQGKYRIIITIYLSYEKKYYLSSSILLQTQFEFIC